MTEWDAYWQEMAQSGYINYTPELLSAICAAMDLSDKRILEVGGGTGGNASWLASQGARMYLLDLSPTALEISKRASKQHRGELNLVCADGYIIPFPDGFFDLIFHVGFLHLFRHPEPLILEQRRVLKQGGYLLIDVPQRYNFYTPWKHLLILLGRWQYGGWETEFSFGQIKHLLEQTGFRLVRAYGREYYPFPFYVMRHFYKIEDKLLGDKRLLPTKWWDGYKSLWERFEQSQWSLYCLRDIGVLGQKVAIASQ